MRPNSVVPTGAERSEAQWRDLFIDFCRVNRSLDHARDDEEITPSS